MKVVILAGGFGTRLTEETEMKPKPMISIGGKPILWHIMKIYSSYGFNDFVICLGYKGYAIKEYFVNYFYHQSDITVDMADGSVEVHKTEAESWRVTLVDTGLNTMTGGRIQRVRKYLNEETFMLTYGDGVGNVNIDNLLARHKKHGKAATLTAVQPLGRFGAIEIMPDENNSIAKFIEKPSGDGSWINGGFFVLEPKIFDYIDGDATVWERSPLDKLASDKELFAYKHSGFWLPMDTLRDKRELEKLWQEDRALWKIW